MRYVVALLSAVALSWGYIEVNRLGLSHYLGQNAPLIGICVFLIIFIVCFSVAHLKEAPAQPLIVADNLNKRIEERFQDRLFIMPPEAYELKWHDGDRKWIDDKDWGRWKRILEKFPKEPGTQKEALKNEDIFWRGWAKYYSEKDESGNVGLVSHARVIDDYKYNERWILREYFAATGNVIASTFEDYIRMLLEQSKAYKAVFWDPESRPAQEARHKKERLDEELRQYNLHGKKDHFERWGHWFVSHVEDAFNNAMKSAQPQPPSDTHGEGGFASPRDIQNLGNTAAHRPSAQTQRFDD